MNLKSIQSGFGIGVLIMAVAALIALPLRTLQFFTVLEGGNGFYSEFNWSVYVLYGVLAAAIVAVIIFGFLKRKKLDYSLNVEKRPGMGILSVTAAISILMDAASCIASFFELQGVVDPANQPSAMGDSIILGIEAVFALLSSVYLIALGIAYLLGKTNGSEYRLISLAPVVWYIFKLVYRFKRTISFTTVSDLMFEMLAFSFMILFFFAFAQVNARVGEKGNEWKIAAYGIPAALLALVCFIPRFIVTLTGNSHLLYSYSPAEYCDFGVALFIISAVVTRIFDKAPETETKQAEAEE